MTTAGTVTGGASATRSRPTGRPAPSHLDRVPPQSEDAEMGTLGSMCLSREAIGAVLPIIGRNEAEWFYRPDHQKLFGTLVDLYDQNKPIDLVVVKDELLRRGVLEEVGGEEYLVRLAESVPSWLNAEHYAQIVRDKALLRELIRAGGQIVDEAYADAEEAREILDRAEQLLFAVTDQRISRHALLLRDFLEETMRQLESREGHYLTGLATGFTELDDLTSGLQRGELIIVAARPSMGKTAWGLCVAEHMAVKNGHAVVFFSMEMSKQQLAQRVLCSRGGVDSHRFRRGMLGDEEITRLHLICGDLQNAPLLIDDTPGMSPFELRAKARRLRSQHNIEAVFVDYLQLMHNPGSASREQEVSAISRGLKGLARELNIPVIALAQLNRQPEGREGHRPRMSDLRESGAIEQDADVVLLLHREEYYKPNDESVKGLADLIIAKQRNGPTGAVTLHFNQKFTRFADHSPVAEPAGYYPNQDLAPF